MATNYLIKSDQQPDANGCTAADYTEQGTVIVKTITPRGRKLLAQDVDVRRVIELGEATIKIGATSSGR